MTKTMKGPWHTQMTRAIVMTLGKMYVLFHCIDSTILVSILAGVFLTLMPLFFLQTDF